MVLLRFAQQEPLALVQALRWAIPSIWLSVPSLARGVRPLRCALLLLCPVHSLQEQATLCLAHARQCADRTLPVPCLVLSWQLLYLFPRHLRSQLFYAVHQLNLLEES